MIDKVRDYNKNQEEHHRRMTIKEKYEKFISKHGFSNHG
jgi:hypothetical protein